jgi:Ca2+/Na+ antiporter
MLGVGGTYLSFVTGNLSSLKVPCAIDAMEKAGVKADSDEGEVISTISIATSSIMTIIVIFVGVCLLSMFQPFFEKEWLKPAFDNVLPALFGGLGVVHLSRYFKIAVLPMALMILLFVFVPFLNSGMVGIMIPVSMVITLVYARILYNKERKADGEE